MTKSDALVYLLKNGAGTKFYAVNQHEPQTILSENHITVVTVEWRYDEVVPSQELLLLFKILENALKPMTESGAHVLVHTTLGCGMRELCYYTTDYDNFIEELNTNLEHLPSLPIGIEYDKDKQWEYLTSIRQLAMGGELLQHQLAA